MRIGQPFSDHYRGMGADVCLTAVLLTEED